MEIAFAQLARARKIGEYNVTMAVPRFRVTSQINCGDAKMLRQ